jgi:hypothetical protein
MSEQTKNGLAIITVVSTVLATIGLCHHGLHWGLAIPAAFFGSLVTVQLILKLR